ncbi:DUF4123 domain-containing protein [Serratia rhizosphaerae]|uniref:DUF4123 domain-containing protein n=1 Tax=Serratia rhizosphaerae TaxID=2597702 RepID=UPI002DBDE570|nr:DUF4123 domain-containing protein [Serratia rhizosphaerae]MEB6335704.1 DUF4123 domain-containing protein [Serratia rhizosphaerae]
MMDNTALLAALPENTEENICLLFEAGAQPEEDFLTFKTKHENRLHSLYIHPQLTEFQNYGPWLLEVDDKEQLKGYLETLPGCVAVIISRRYPPSLAVQLSRGCTLVPPEGAAVLTRFYAGHVIEVLAACAEHDWHAYLFNGITQWWLPGETQWQLLAITPSEVENPVNHIIRLDNVTWQQIADKPEVTSVLREWQKMPTSKAFPPCAQRLMVIKALKKAERMELERPEDRILYALFFLNGGRKMPESGVLTRATSH